MVHAALLLLMLEAVTKDLVFTISLKRSTQNLQLSTNWAGRLPHLRLLPAGAVAGWGLHPLESAALSRRTPISDIGRLRNRECLISSLAADCNSSSDLASSRVCTCSLSDDVCYNT